MKTKIFLLGVFVIATIVTFSFTNAAKNVEKNSVNTTQEDFAAPAGGFGSERI
ncbi:MAG: hypothetical protein KF845_07185 [Cyclobacteriaceae bacterium]|nr:hypothetical protein [Cyclobacteriaceae bacterium]